MIGLSWSTGLQLNRSRDSDLRTLEPWRQMTVYWWSRIGIFCVLIRLQLDNGCSDLTWQHCSDTGKVCDATHEAYGFLRDRCVYCCPGALVAVDPKTPKKMAVRSLKSFWLGLTLILEVYHAASGQDYIIDDTHGLGRRFDGIGGLSGGGVSGANVLGWVMEIEDTW